MKGDAVDVVIVTRAQNEELEKQGKLLAGSRAELAGVGYVFVRTGAARPDLGTVDAFKHAMLAAKSIAMGNPAGGAPVGVYSAGLMQRLGLAEDLKAKIKLFPSGTEVAEAVAKGESEIGIGLASDAIIIPGLIAVPLPAEIQNNVYAGDSRQQQASRCSQGADCIPDLARSQAGLGGQRLRSAITLRWRAFVLRQCHQDDVVRRLLIKASPGLLGTTVNRR